MGRVKPVTHLGSLSKGRSVPQLIEFSDRRKYVVKFKNNPQGNWVVAYEYIVNSLAGLLELPVPKFKIVHVPREFIAEHADLSMHGFKSGNQFASRFMEGTTLFSEFSEPLSRDQIVNRHHAAGLIVFDHWVGNSDRNVKNLLLRREKNGKYSFWMIDQANCFNITTTNPERKFLPLKVRSKDVYRWCNSLIDNKDELTSYVKKIRRLKNEHIRDIVYSMPKDWKFSDVRQDIVYNHILYAKKALPEIINKYIRSHYM